jgi:hypothetical protein
MNPALQRLVEAVLGVHGDGLWFTLPFAASSQGGQATSPTVAEALTQGAWAATVGRRAGGDTVTIRAPFSGRLRVERRAGAEAFVLDNASTASLYHDVHWTAVPDPFAPIPGRCTITGLDPTGFKPARAVKREARRRKTSETAAAAQLLAALRAPGAAAAIDVSAGDVLGRVGAGGPVTISCALVDGSPVPLAWLYRELARRAPKALAAADRAAPFVTGTAPFSAGTFLDLVVLDGADQFDSLPRGAQQGTVEAGWPGSPATLTIAERNRRFVLPVPAQPPATVPVGVLVEGQPVPITGAGGIGQAGATVGTWQLPLSSSGPVALTLGPAKPAIVVKRPPVGPFTPPGGSQRTWNGILIPLAPADVAGGGTAAFQLRLEGISSSGGQVTATIGGQPAGAFPVINTAFAGSIQVPAGGPHELTLADGQATLTLGVIPVAIVLGAPRPAWWGSNDPNVLPRSTPWPDPPQHYTITPVESTHPSATDEGPATGWDRDTLRLGARLLDNGALAAELGAGAWTVAWTLTLRTAAPIHRINHRANPVDPRPKPVPGGWPEDNVRWIGFDLVGGGAGIPFATAWDPPPLTAVRASATCDNPAGSRVTDSDWTRLSLGEAAPWDGGTPGPQKKRTGAGPACGTARLAAQIGKDGGDLQSPSPLEFRVVGYNFDALDWRRFYQFLRGRIHAVFGTAYPGKARLGLNDDGLCRVLLAILAHESKFLHYDARDLAWPEADADSRKATGAGLDRALWPRGPVTNAPPPAAVQLAGLPITAQGADVGLGQIADRPTFTQYYDWRANLDRAVDILHKGFNLDRVRKAEVDRLVAEVARNDAADGPAARAALSGQPNPLADFLAAVQANATWLLQSFVKLYNGPGDPTDPEKANTLMPYRSTLAWDQATKAFTQPAGPAVHPHDPNCRYIFLPVWGFRDLYARAQAGFTPDDQVDRVPVANLGDLRDRLFHLPS